MDGTEYICDAYSCQVIIPFTDIFIDGTPYIANTSYNDVIVVVAVSAQ